MSRLVTAGLLIAVVAVALALRCPSLDGRPMHNDEAVNAIKFRDLWEHGVYRYDPNEHHGPTLFYFTLYWEKLTGAPDFKHFDESRFRWVTVLFGVGLILLLPLVADGLGRGALLAVALLTAISPAMVFYSRYFIHEMPFTFFTALALAAAWRYWRSGKLGWALLAGAAMGLTQATKETVVFTLAAIVFAALGVWATKRWRSGTSRSLAPSEGERVGVRGFRFMERSRTASHTGVHGDAAGCKINYRHILAALVVWLAVAIIFFSSFFTNASGPVDSLRTYLPWLHRVEGASPHIHPWYFYLERLGWFHAARGPVWSEALILALALVGGLAAFRRGGLPGTNTTFLRFVALYTLILTAIYSVVAYKTPWCLLTFWHGMILLAGAGAAGLIQWAPRHWMKIAITMALLGGAAQLSAQALRSGSEEYCADRRNPYVYAQTSPDLVDELVARVNHIAQASPRVYSEPVKVMAPDDDYWPLPWYLRAFENVGWYRRVPDDPYAAIMIVSPQFHAELDTRGTHVMAGTSQLRPDVFLDLYVRKDLWDAYLKSRK